MHARVLLTGLMLGQLVLGCTPPDDAGTAESLPQPLVSRAPRADQSGTSSPASPGAGVVVLGGGEPAVEPTPDARPAVFQRPGNLLVSPEWSRSGRYLAARGRLGLGLFVYDAWSGQLVYEDEAHSGAFSFVGEALCTYQQTPDEQRVDLATGQAARATCGTPMQVDPELGVVLHVGKRDLFTFHGLNATVTREAPDGTLHLIATDASWAVVSPGEDRVAFTRGPIGESELAVAGIDASVEELGRGVFPVWVDADRLLFAELTIDESLEGPAAYTSDLVLVDLRDGRRTQLTETPEVAELEPVLSPDGRHLAVADWRSGRMLVLDLGGAP